uniref:Organic solute transporter subunit alpha-like n=1 Tax=Phallusia mammillata TaxID=59560 RepID=A0A6F9DNH9_9ASCI|nr:organic solute transporter subunit alpha-like [Phallusia mammillata]
MNATAAHNITGNVSANTFDPIQAAKEEYKYHCLHDPLPNAREVVASFDAAAIALHSILIVMATITVALFIEEVFFLKANIKLSYRRRLSILQAGIPPVFAVSSVVGTFFPGGNIMIDFVCSVYFGFGLHALLVLMVNYFGGMRQLLLRFDGRFVQISTGPFCCCCFCLPSFRMTKKNFQILWYATFQAAFTRPIVLFFQGVMEPDGTVPIPGLVYSACLIASMLSGMWALVIFRRASGDFISRFRVTAKFFTFQMVLLIANLQPFIIRLCYIPCALPYTVRARQIVVNYQITTVEFFILALITRCLYRRISDNDQLPPLTRSDDKADIAITSGNSADEVLLTNGNSRTEDVV